jgi:hypothetical protein
VRSSLLLLALFLAGCGDGAAIIGQEPAPSQVYTFWMESGFTEGQQWNTLSMATADRANGINFQHRGDVADTLEKARETIDLTRRTFEVTVEQYQFLASRRVENLQSYVMQVLESPADTKAEDMPKAVQEITTLYATGKGAELPGVTGTWWGAYNATTEWVDWKRGTDKNRLNNAWFGIGAAIKQSALQIATDMAKAA